MSVFARTIRGVTDAGKALGEIERSERGLTRTELRDRLQRNWPAARLDDALAVLLADDLIVTAEQYTRGRPATRYIAAQYADGLDDDCADFADEQDDGTLADALKARTCPCDGHALPARDLDGLVRCHRCGYEIEDHTIECAASGVGSSR